MKKITPTTLIVLALILLDSCCSVKIENPTQYNYLPNKKSDSIQRSLVYEDFLINSIYRRKTDRSSNNFTAHHKSKEDQMDKIKREGLRIVNNGSPKVRTWPFIQSTYKQYVVNSITKAIDTNNNKLEKLIFNHPNAYLGYSNNLNFELRNKNPNTIKEIKGTYFELTPSVENNTLVLLKDFNLPKNHYKNLIKDISLNNSKIIFLNYEILKNILSKKKTTLKLLFQNGIIKSLKNKDICEFITKFESGLTNKELEEFKTGKCGFYYENNKYEIVSSDIYNNKYKQLRSALISARPKYNIKIYPGNLLDEAYSLEVILANKKSLILKNFTINKYSNHQHKIKYRK